MKDEELTLWEDDKTVSEEQELTLWEDDESASDNKAVQNTTILEEEKVFGQTGDEGISLWSDATELPPISELLLREGDRVKQGNEYYIRDYDDAYTGLLRYGLGDETKQREGQKYIESGAKKQRDTVCMRQRAVVLLEGLVCPRDAMSALIWLHMAAREGDIKALRILVYALFGMEKILVSPRIGASKADKEGRSIRLTDLFDGVNLSEKEKLYYVKTLIENTVAIKRSLDKKKFLFVPISEDRPLLTLVYGYLIRTYEIDKELIDTERMLKKWGNVLYAEIKRQPLYDGVLIQNKESESSQISRLCRMFDVEEEDLEKPITWEWNPYREFRRQQGDYDHIKSINIDGNRGAYRLMIHRKEIENWPWRKLREIVYEKQPSLYFAPFYVYCMRRMVEKFFEEKIDYSDEKGLRKIHDVKYIFKTIKYLSEHGEYRYGYSEFGKSYDYKYLAEKEDKFWDIVKEMPDKIRVHQKLLSPKEIEEKIKENTKKYSKYFSVEEFNALKEAAAGDEWPKEASYLLGLRYEYGQGTEADWSEAVKCFKKAEGSLFKNNSQKHLERLEPQTEYFKEMKNLLQLLHSPQAATAAARIEDMSKKGFSPAMLVIAKQKLESDDHKRADFIFSYDQRGGLELLKDAAELRNMTAMYELVLIARNGKYNFNPNEDFANYYQKMQEKILEEDLRME